MNKQNIHDKVALYSTIIVVTISILIGVSLSFNTSPENVDGLILISIAMLLINSIKSGTDKGGINE